MIDVASVAFVLLILSLASACMCLLLSTAMVGRKIADLDYQKAAGINGTNRLQAIKELRTHGMRVIVGITFGVFAIGLLAPIPEPYRMLINRALFVAVPLGYVVVSILDWSAEKEQQRIEIRNELEARATVKAQVILDENARLKTLQESLAGYREMASEAVANLEAAAAQARELRGQTVAPILAAVVPEHNSPVTPEQAEHAARQTLRARATASALDLGLPPRETPSMRATPVEEHRDPVDVESIQSGAADDIVKAVRRAQEDGG